MDARARVIASERREGGALLPVVEAAHALSRAARELLSTERWLRLSLNRDELGTAIDDVSVVGRSHLGCLERACEALDEQLGAPAAASYLENDGPPF